MSESATVAVPLAGTWLLEIETGHKGRGVFVGFRHGAHERTLTAGIGVKGARRIAKLLLQAAEAAEVAQSRPLVLHCRFCRGEGDMQWLGAHECSESKADAARFAEGKSE